MKRLLLIILLIALVRAPVIAAPAIDNRPLVSTKYLSQQDFADQGLCFWAEDATNPRRMSQVFFIKGGDETSPTRRTFFYVGVVDQTVVGGKLPIYCTSVTGEKDANLILDGFLAGYTAAHSR